MIIFAMTITELSPTLKMMFLYTNIRCLQFALLVFNVYSSNLDTYCPETSQIFVLCCFVLIVVYFLRGYAKLRTS